MKTLKRTIRTLFNDIDTPRRQSGRGLSLRIASLAICSALALPGVALAKKPADDTAGCVVFPPTVYTGFPFTVKVVRDPAYPGSWIAPTLDMAAVFSKTDGSTVTQTHTETVQRYGVTYINATLSAPSCNGDPCEIDLAAGVDITAVIQEPVTRGKKTSIRETSCRLLNAPVTMSN